MSIKLYHIFKRYFESDALVLLYHRIAEPATDVWEMAVSPGNFEAHLQVLKEANQVVSLRALTESLKKKKVKKGSIAICFDDGYEDNYLEARPLLKKYELPATFFISSGPEEEEGFWWDELEALIFSTRHLPTSISMVIGGRHIEQELKDETVLDERQKRINTLWKACEEDPPSLRCRLYLQLWQALKPLPMDCQQEALTRIQYWANAKNAAQRTNKRMSVAQLRELATHPLFDIAAHTAHHAALACHELEFQQQELMVNKEHLSNITGEEVPLLSYPYGNYNRETEIAAASSGFTAAFTTEAKRITNQSHPFRLGRFQVKNFSAQDFTDHIEKWKKTK